MAIKIFTDINFCTTKWMPITMLDPLWPGRSLENSTTHNVQTNRLTNYTQRFHDIFELVDIEQADFAVFPVSWEVNRTAEGSKKLAELRELAHKYHKKVIVFVGGDLQPNLPFDDLIVFHTSLVSLRRQKNEFGMPAIIEDLIIHHYHNQFTWRPWVAKPSISFCGTSLPLKMPWGTKKIKEIGRFILFKTGVLKFYPELVGYAPRTSAILKLRKSSKIRSRLIIRASSPLLWAYGFLLRNGGDQLNALRTEYLESIFDSDYVLCVRGNGNYSIRLYETLCMGRIPVIVNTGLVLPFEQLIPWKEFCVWVEEQDIDKIDEMIVAFHQQHRGDAFAKLQHTCRKYWLNWLSAEGFFSNFHLQF